MTRTLLPIPPPKWPTEKKRNVTMKASKPAARTEHTAPAITPMRTSFSRKYTAEMFVFARGVSSNAMEANVPDLVALDAFARRFAPQLRAGSVVALRGPLGAGKTTFVRAVVRCLHGSDDAVSSPTFVFRQLYRGDPPIEHLDLYRIDDPAELDELGLEDAFAPDRVTLVEWPERAPALLPPDAIAVGISGSGDGPRTISVGWPNG
jgi:tRNA threonylcarbamoyladenosine biosynthesis protein TsaE